MADRRILDLLKRARRARWGIATMAMVYLLLLVSGAIAEPVIVAVGLCAAIVAFLYSDRHASLRKRLEARFPASRRADGLAVLRPIIAGLPDPLILLDATGHMILHNPQADRVLGRHEDGLHVSSVIRGPQVLEAVRRARESGEPAQADHYLPVPMRRHFEVLVVPVSMTLDRDADRPGAHVLIVMRDLTQQERVERMRADFVANASHELRTPLASLTGFIETLQGPAREDPEARDRFLSIMRAEARRMSRLIDDLLSLTRIELNAHLRPTEHVDVSLVVSHVVTALSPLAEENGMHIECSRPEGPLIVLGDRDELIQVFENIIENAIRYGRSGGRVDVAVEGKEVGLRGKGVAGAVISVRDFGPGIAAEHIPRLTERFYRVDSADSREKGGTGLGLAIVKHILTRHEGELAIASEVGSGATFSVRLPLAGDHSTDRKSEVEDVTKKF